MTALPVAVHELLVAPAAVALAFAHARRALGASRAVGELLALALYGFALERVAIVVFASHTYGNAWRLAPLGVPVAVAAVWAAVIASAMAVTARLGLATPASRAAGAALVGISLDLLMEPVAVRGGLWTWTPPGPWLGVPVGNFVGWAVIVAAYTLGAELWAGGDGLAGQALRRVALAAGSIAALVLVGFAWRTAGAERLFEGVAGWTAWGVALLAAGTLGRGARRAADPATLAGRLGAAGGALPSGVLLLLAAVFAADALALSGTSLAAAATGTVGVLAVLTWRVRR